MSKLLDIGKTWLRTTRKNLCPICQRAGYCEVSRDDKTVHCMKVVSDRPFAHRQGGWLHAHPLYFEPSSLYLNLNLTTNNRSNQPSLSSTNRRAPATNSPHQQHEPPPASSITKTKTKPSVELGELSPSHNSNSTRLPTSLPFCLGQSLELGAAAPPPPPPDMLTLLTTNSTISTSTSTNSNANTPAYQSAGEQALASLEAEAELAARVLAAEQAVRADLATLHAVYTDFLALCELIPEHAQAIAAKRQLNPSELAAMGIKSVPQGALRAQIMAILTAKYGAAVLLTVPGFIPADLYPADPQQHGHGHEQHGHKLDQSTAGHQPQEQPQAQAQAQVTIACGKSPCVFLPVQARGQLTGLVVTRYKPANPNWYSFSYNNNKKGKNQGKGKSQDMPKYWWFSSAKYGGPEALSSLSLYLPLPDKAQPLAQSSQAKANNSDEFSTNTSTSAQSLFSSTSSNYNQPYHNSHQSNQYQHQIVITEGQFKAFIAAQYLGCPVVAVPGVSSWETTGVVGLVLELVAAASPSPESMLVTVAYDSEINPHTDRAKLALCQALVDAGLKVALADWDNLGGKCKGIDDLAQAGLLATLLRYSRYVPGLVGLPIDRLLDENRLDENLNPASDKKATLLRSPRGTGKTYWLTRLISRYLQKDMQVIVIGHRVSLLSEAARRHGINFYGDFKLLFEPDKDSNSGYAGRSNSNDSGTSKGKGKGKGKGSSHTSTSTSTRGNTSTSSSTSTSQDLGVPDGLAITFDSLDMLQPANLKENLVIIIDESEQGLMHLAGSTIRAKRHRILTKLNMLLGRAVKIIFLDADISRLSYNFLTTGDFARLPLVRPDQLEIICNEAKPDPKTYVRYTRKEALIQQLIAALDAGKRCFIATNGRKTTKYLYKLLTRRFPELSGWLINAHTSGEPGEKAKIDNINQAIQLYDYTIASPTLGTGVSIDYTGIDSVFLFGEPGVNTHNDLLQQAARVRQPVSQTVHAWISPKKRPDLPTDVEAINHRLVATPLETANLQGRKMELMRRLLTDPVEQQYFDLLAEIEAARNASWHDQAGHFWRAVAREGHTVIEAGDAALPASSFKEIKADYKGAKELVQAEYTQSILDAPEIEVDEYRRLKLKSYLNETQRAATWRYTLASFYGLAVTEELIQWDNESRMRSKITNFLAASDLDYAAEQDRRDMGELPVPVSAAAAATAGAGSATAEESVNLSNNQLAYGYAYDRPLAGDWRNLAARTRKRLQVLTAAGFIDEQTGQVDFSHSFTDESLAAAGLGEWLERDGGKERKKVTSLLGIQISPTNSSLTRLVTSVLAQLGLACDARQYRTGESYLDPLTGRKKAVRKREYTVSRTCYEQVRELALARRAVLTARTQAGQNWAQPGEDVTPWQQSV